MISMPSSTFWDRSCVTFICATALVPTRMAPELVEKYLKQAVVDNPDLAHASSAVLQQKRHEIIEKHGAQEE